MPDKQLAYEFAVASMPTFYALVEQAFAFLPTAYGCALHAQHVDGIESIRDMRAIITYVGEKIEVDLVWDIAAMTIREWFVEVLIPHVSPQERALQEGRQGARQIGLHMLAELLGHADDPDFVLGIAPVSDGRAFNRNFKRLQTDFPGVIAGLARATERYGGDILRGDTSIFPQVMRLYAEKRRAMGFS